MGDKLRYQKSVKKVLDGVSENSERCRKCVSKVWKIIFPIGKVSKKCQESVRKVSEKCAGNVERHRKVSKNVKRVRKVSENVRKVPENVKNVQFVSKMCQGIPADHI